MADKNLSNILNEYVKNNDIFNSLDKVDYSAFDTYQKSLYSFIQQDGKPEKNSEVKKTSIVTPINNINFSKGLSVGINSTTTGDLGNFKESAFYLLSSLYVKDINTSTIDKDRLAVLFKSGVGISDLPYSLILYLGGLHHFHKNSENNRLIGDWYNYPNELDGSESFDLKINGTLAPIYGAESTKTGNILLQSVPIITDKIYRESSVNVGNFIPKFGYGTYSKYMNDYHNFMVDNQAVKNQVRIDDTTEVFHIYGAKNGFVKSFKTYGGGINFMGHYTILKNKYGFTKLTLDEINNFVSSNVFDGLSENDLYNMFLAYSKLKTGYLYGRFSENGIKTTITTINQKFNGKFNFTAKVKVNDTKSFKISYFTYLVFANFFNRVENISTLSLPGAGVLSQINVIFDEVNKLFLDVLNHNFFNGITESSEIDYLIKFILKFWDIEKKYHNESEFSSTQDPFMVLLYPSAGGVFYPNNIIPKDSVLLDRNIFNKKEFASSVTPLRRNKQINEYLPLNYTPKEIDFRGRSNTRGILNKPEGLTTHITDRVYLYSDDKYKLSFDNRSVIENATRLFWYDTAHGGLQFATLDNINKNNHNEKTNDSLISTLSTNFDKNNYFTEPYRKSSGYTDLTIWEDQNRLRLYDLYSIIDIEKFNAFENVFLEFATSAQCYGITHNDNHTFETLMKGIGTISDPDITPITLDSPITVEDSMYLLLGYSSYNYYFCDQYGISAKINAILTQAQYNRHGKVFKDFASQKLPINNYSTVGSIAVPGDNTKQLYYDNFIFRPDVMFVPDIKGKLVEAKYLKYYTRKLIFGDKLISSYKTQSVNADKPLIIKYFYDGDDPDITYSYSRLIVNLFFFLNIEVTENNVILLYNLITDLMRYLLNNNKSKAPTELQSIVKAIDFEIQNNDQLGAVIKYLFNLNVLSNKELDKQISEYLVKFVGDFYDQNIMGVNNHLDAIKVRLEGLTKLDPKDPNSLISKLHIKDSVDELKGKTYYNIKNLYDKYISYQPKTIHTYPQDYIDVNVNSELDVNNGSLFYNFLFKDGDINDPQNVGDSVTSIFDSKMPKHLIEYVNIVDRGNRDIGGDILIDVLSLGDSLELKFNSIDNHNNNVVNSEITNKSVYSLFSDIATKNDFLLHPMNSYVDYLSPFSDVNNNIDKYADNLFGVHSNTERVDSNPSFILQWINHTSSFEKKLNGSSNLSLMNSFPLDIDTTRQPFGLTEVHTIPSDVKNGNVTSFVVDFGNKNQSMFSNVKLDTSQFANTEESINAFINLVNKDAKGIQTVASGNLYSLMETRSYTCQVQSMGNAMIQPLTYFYLKDVPLFDGSYWITNVEHNVTPNNMVTTFKGTRQPIANKTTNKSDIIRQIADTIAKITTTKASDTDNDYTVGTIKQNRRNTVSNPYGTFYQMSQKSYTMGEFQGNQILYSFLSKYFPANTEIYKMVLMVLYNRAKRFAYLEYGNKPVKPNIIITYMVDMALNLRANSLSFENELYFDTNKEHSLSELYNEYPVNPEKPIWKTLTALTEAKSIDDVINVLKPTSLVTQKLIITDINGKYNTGGDGVFNTKTNTAPKINFTDTQTSDFSNFWRAYDIIYMKYIATDPKAEDNIYNVNVNNYNNIKEYQYLNTFAVPGLNVNSKNINNIYLGCFDKILGISFFGYVNDSSVTPDDYGIDIQSNESLLGGYTPTELITTKTPIKQRVLDRYNIVKETNIGFGDKMKQISTNLGVDELDLVRVIYAESGIRSKAQYGDGGKDIPYTTNRASTATGYIQFLESTAIKLGTTTKDLYEMTPIKQLEYVEKYLKSTLKNNERKTIYDIYSAVFYPVLIGKPDDYILGSLTAPINDSKSAFKIAENNEVIAKNSKRLINGRKVIDVTAFKNYVNTLA